MTIKPIETIYKGYRFRSRLEARWAIIFDTMGWNWKYEVEGYELDGIRYLPDFWFPDENWFAEIKPEINENSSYIPEVEKIYLGGKMNDWRNDLDLKHCIVSGPFFEEHDIDTVKTDVDDLYNNTDIFFAWIDSLDSYATFTEIGMAYILQQERQLRDIFLGFEKNLYKKNKDELWFLENLATESGVFETPQKAINSFIIYPSEEIEKCSKLSKLYDVNLFYGLPYEDNFCMANFNNGTLRFIKRKSDYFGNDYNEKVKNALEKAKQARFEYGENG